MSDSARDRIVGKAAGSHTETIYAGAGAGTDWASARKVDQSATPASFIFLIWSKKRSRA